MPSDNKKAKAAAKKLGNRKKQSDLGKKAEASEISKQTNKSDACLNGVNNNETQVLANTEMNEKFIGSEDEDESKIAMMKNEIESLNLCNENVSKFRSVTGVLTSQKESRDIHINNLCITFHGQEILQDTSIELNNGRRYGLIGLNGCGKSTLLAVFFNDELPIPSHIDRFLLQREMPPSDSTALQVVMEVDSERIRLETEAEYLSLEESIEAQDRLVEVYERLDELDFERAEKRAAEILFGLGFTKDMQNKKVKHFSGGWRMRISLARALFVKPALLMLDEPTNHLDLNACVWLETELSRYKRILVIISHSEDFLNGVCTNIVHMQNKKLTHYTGNYDQYILTRMELEENQMKKYKWEQDQMAHMKDYIARFGHGSRKLARQAQSKEKTLKKMVDNGLTKKVTVERNLVFYFPNCGEIPPPVIQIQNVSFRYNKEKPLIYDNIDFGIDLDTRVALVGPNGAGKSTLLKLIAAELEPTDGLIRRHSHCRIGRYHQHLHEILNLNRTPLEWMMQQFPDIKERDEMRKKLGRYGLTGSQQTCPIKSLSDGQRCRIIFAWLAERCPHMLLLDEPTNHLDLETIDSLAEALNEFEGGLLLVSHDFRLIGRVAEEIWVCNHGTITKWPGDIYSYKRSLIKEIEKGNALSKLIER